MQSNEGDSVSAALSRRIDEAITAAGGWLGFDRFMAMALYEPGLGYYSRESRKFGALPESGSDFVTAPELSPLFGRALARQVAQALAAAGSGEVWEFGAGSGALAAQLLESLGERVTRYTIVDLSGSLRARQRRAHGRPALVRLRGAIDHRGPQNRNGMAAEPRLPNRLNSPFVSPAALCWPCCHWP